MKIALLVGLFVLFGGLCALFVWRLADRRADRMEMERLRAFQPVSPMAFSHEALSGLPEPAQRFLRFAIAEGTPLMTVAEIAMTGKFSLGTKDAPNYMDMKAQQVLAAPFGAVWRMSGGKGVMRVSGSDSGRWTRFWLMGLLPVARAGGTDDHARSAFGRFAAETAFWAPAVLLSGDVTWEGVNENTARYVLRRDNQVQAVDISIDQDGRPKSVVFQRWTNANAEKSFREQPFGGTLSGFRSFDGFTLPTHVEAGNHFGTDDYFPFFIADVSSVTFPQK